MQGDGVNARYRAFLSYSHSDAAFAAKLHRALEGYALPRRLWTAGRPKRLSPIFRDMEELPAHHDLSEKVRAALGASESLIVMCSPAAAASPWVAREIEAFRALHPDRPVLAALLEGEPKTAFPAALTRSEPHGTAAEPLAADFRKAADGWRLALLKLIAGALGLGLDELVQRDAQRQVRRVTTITAAALAVTVSMALLTIYALQSRAEALRQRAEAEGLIEFMMTDLHDRLEDVGRIEILSSVNARALAYYDNDAARLPRDSAARRALVLLALGADEIRLGHKAAAQARLEEAYAITARLTRQAPENAEFAFAHGQSEYWMGYWHYRWGDRSNPQRRREVERHWRAYDALADRMVRLAPGNQKYQREKAFAEGDLCTLALRVTVDLAEAAQHCPVSLRMMETLARRRNAPPGAWQAVANREAWVADVHHQDGDLAGALVHRRRQAAIMDRLVVEDPRSLSRREGWVNAQRGLAIVEAEAGLKATARSRLVGAAAALDAMIAFDPQNTAWTERRRQVADDLRQLNE